MTAQTRQMTWGAMQTCRVGTQTCLAFKQMWESLKTKAESLEHIKWTRKCKTHTHAKSQHSSVPIKGNESALEMEMEMYSQSCQSTLQVEYSFLDKLKVQRSELQQALRARWLETVMATKMETVETATPLAIPSDNDVMTNSSSIDSTWVNEVLLAAESQPMHWDQVLHNRDSLVSPRPPVQPFEAHPYGPTRWQHQHRMLKIEHLNDKKSAKMPRVEMTHLQHACTTQPPENPSKCCNRVIGPIQQHGQIKIVPINISQTPKVKMAHLQHKCSTQPCGNLSRHFWEVHIPRLQHGMLKIEHLNNKKLAKLQKIVMAHLECTSAVQPHEKALNHVHGVNRLSCRCRRPKIKQISISQVQNSEVTHLEHTRTTQPHRSLSKCSYRVIGPKCWCGQPKIAPTNVSPMQNGKTAYRLPGMWSDHAAMWRWSATSP